MSSLSSHRGFSLSGQGLEKRAASSALQLPRSRTPALSHLLRSPTRGIQSTDEFCSAQLNRPPSCGTLLGSNTLGCRLKTSKHRLFLLLTWLAVASLLLDAPHKCGVFQAHLSPSTLLEILHESQGFVQHQKCGSHTVC